MDCRLIFMILAITAHWTISNAQHENIPYEDVGDICERCICLTEQDTNKRYHHLLDCASKHFKHILARWPVEFGKNHNDVDIGVSFSGNSIEILQQIPATNASLTFSCRHCGIKHLQAPTFMDVPNIQRLYLSYNDLTTDDLTADVFRGPYRSTGYEPIGLRELDLSHNKLTALDRKIFEHTPNLVKLNISYNRLLYLNSLVFLPVTNLEVLDLTQTGLKALSEDILKSLKNIKVLNLAGNNFTVPPRNLHLIGHSLESLNLADNSFSFLNGSHFQGLKALRRLNISSNHKLKTISVNAFEHLHSLESLYCAHNPELEQFNLTSLENCRNLTHLDISYCSITSFIYTTKQINGTTEITLKPWPRLYTLEIVGNPWLCDCELLKTLEYVDAKSKVRLIDDNTRCDTPYFFSGALLSNLTAEKICSMQIPKRYRVVDEDPPRFLRKRYIILTLITASIVIGVGLVIGLIVGCIRRRLKRDDFGVEPIRYTSVRCSTLSAFSNPNNTRNST